MTTGSKTLIPWEDLVAGIMGGIVSTLAVHPLDLAKIRMQVNEGTGVIAYRPKSTNMYQTLVEIARNRGFRGLYMGLTPNIIGASSAWGLYFLFYSTMKNYAQENDPTRTLSSLSYLSYATLSGALTQLITNPIWVVKTRLCLQYEQACPANASPPPTTACNRPVYGTASIKPTQTTWNTLISLWRYEGMSGLYRGFVPSLIGVSHGALQFMIYERLRNMYSLNYKHQTVDKKLSPIEYLAFASLSKVIATVATYPYQVIRSRMQDQHRKYSGILHVIRELWKGEGFYGLYKGLVPNLFRVVPSCAITFAVYESTKQFLKPHT